MFAKEVGTRTITGFRKKINMLRERQEKWNELPKNPVMNYTSRHRDRDRDRERGRETRTQNNASTLCIVWKASNGINEIRNGIISVYTRALCESEQNRQMTFSVYTRIDVCTACCVCVCFSERINAHALALAPIWRVDLVNCEWNWLPV